MEIMAVLGLTVTVGIFLMALILPFKMLSDIRRDVAGGYHDKDKQVNAFKIQIACLDCGF